MDIAIPPRVIAEVTRLGRAATVAVIAATCGLGVLGCLLAALWIAAVPYVGPAGAPLVVAGALAIAAGAIIAVLCRRAPPPVTAAANDDVRMLLEAASQVTRADKVPVLLAGLLAGLVAGVRPK